LEEFDMVGGNCLLLGLFAFAAWGQTADRALYFAHLDTAQAIQEFDSMMRSISDVREVSVDVAKRSLTVNGTADQIAAAAWLTAELDKPGGATGTRDFPFNEPKAPLAQVVYLSRVHDARDLQEIVNAVRAVVDLQRLFPMNQQKAIVMRGTAEQVKAADWLLGVLDQPAGALPADAAPPDYRLPQTAWDPRGGLIMRVAFLTHIDTPDALQEMTNATRYITDMTRCFPLYSSRLLAMRGNDDQIALADWLVKQLDGPAGQGTKEFKVGGAGNQIAQVAYVNAGTPESLKETVSQIRTQANIANVFPIQARQAVAMRGTADQLARAQQVIQSRQGK
jgi:hypothetical protein